MKQLKRIAAALTGCALALTLTACSGGEEPVIERPADLSEKAIYADYLGIAAELPDSCWWASCLLICPGYWCLV